MGKSQFPVPKREDKSLVKIIGLLVYIQFFVKSLKE